MILSRREALAGAAMLALPGMARAHGEDARLQHVLDTLPKDERAAAKLAALRRFDPARLGLSARLDLLTIRAGLAIDARIERRFAGVTKIADVPATERAAYYALLLQRRTGSTTIDRARARIDQELELLGRMADVQMQQRGYRNGIAGLTAMMTSLNWTYRGNDVDSDRADAVAFMNKVLADRREFVGQAFERIPPWCLDVSVRLPAPDEPAGRRIVPQPGKPGSYIVDLKDIVRRPIWTLGSVVAHELLPGHLLQLGIEGASGMHPLRADYAAAFVEGWATYVEGFAFRGDHGTTDLNADIGCIHWQLFRAARARMDIGMHVEGWSVDRAHAFLEQHQGPPVYFAPYDVELRRTAAEPANRAADAVAWLAIADRAPAYRGDWRPVRRFHTRMLAGGRKRIEDLGAVA